VDEHDTPVSEPLLPEGSGVLWIVQLLPSHTSASVCGAIVPGDALVNSPTATHAVAEVHDTPSRFSSPVGLGVLWIDQSIPFQRSASCVSRPATYLFPTAAHAVGDVHDTPLRVAAGSAFAGLWTVQLVPSQSSASVPAAPDPTAMQAVAAGHDTLFSVPNVLDGYEMLWLVQLVPFQRSSSGTSVPLLSVYVPTAVHAIADEHDTAVSAPWAATVALGVRWTDHREPFQRSAKISGCTRGTLKSYPTAVQADGEVHETPVRGEKSELVDVEGCCSDHRDPFHRSTTGLWNSSFEP
jgi:hypothetical protein